MADTLSDLIASVGAYQSGAKAATDQLVGLTASQAAISAADAKVYQQVSVDSGTVATAAQAAALKTQAARVQVANAFHSNINDVSEQISLYAAAADSAQQKKDEALAEIDRKDSVSLFDNPIEYIMNQFTINGDIAKHNAANAQLESANARIQSMNLNAQTSIRTQNEISEPLTVASAEAAARTASAAALIEADKATQQGLAYNAQGIQAALTQSKESLGLQFQVEQARNTEKQIAISLQHLALSKQEFAFRQQEYQEKKDDKEETRALGQSVVDTVNRGRLAILGPGNELDDISGKMLLAQLKGKSPLSTQMQKFYDAGEASKVAGRNIIGVTPAMAASTLNAVPSAQLNVTQGVIKDLLSTSASQVGSALNAGELNRPNTNPALAGLNPKDPASISTAMNKVAQQNLNAYAANIKPGDSANPYQIPSINQLGAASPTVQQLPVYQKVFAPLVSKGVQLSDPNQIFALVGDAVAQGKITHAEALDLSVIYHVGVKTNLAMRNLPGFGLTPSLSYNTRLETSPKSFNSTDMVDLTHPDALSNALMKRQAKLLSSKMMSGDAPNRVQQFISDKTDNLFVPQPAAAKRIDDWANSSIEATNNFFNNLPHASPETPQAPSKGN